MVTAYVNSNRIKRELVVCTRKLIHVREIYIVCMYLHNQRVINIVQAVCTSIINRLMSECHVTIHMIGRCAGHKITDHLYSYRVFITMYPYTMLYWAQDYRSLIQL